MVLGFAHEVGLATATALAIAVVLLGGEFPSGAWLLLAGPVASLVIAARGVHIPSVVAPLVGAASILVGAGLVVRLGTESAVLAGTCVLLGLLVARLLVRRTPEHDLQAIVVSVLVVLAGSVLNSGISYIVVLSLYAVAVVWALSTRQLIAGVDPVHREEVRRRDDVLTPAFFVATAFVSISVLASAGLLFAIFPRVGFGELGSFLSRTSRLPDQVGLGAEATLGRGGTAAFARATGIGRAPFEAGLYLRGVVYDVVTLDGFSRSAREDDTRMKGVALAPAPTRGRYEVMVMPVVGDTLLTFGSVDVSRALGGGSTNPNLPLGVAGGNRHDELKAVGPVRSPMRYEVVGGLTQVGYIPPTVKREPVPLEQADRTLYLALPSDFDPVLADLAVQAATPADDVRSRVDNIRRFLMERFSYASEVPRAGDDPVRDFLLNDRRGHCEVFAAAFALLLRSQGIPARVVGGFQGGAWDDGVVVFLERHAHAWVEWWLDDVGWIVDDATPVSSRVHEELVGFESVMDRMRRFWDDSVIDYSFNDQMESLTRARRGWRILAAATGISPWAVAPLAVAVFVLIALVLIRRRMRRDDVGVHPLALEILAAVSRWSHAEITPALTVREAVQRVAGPPAVLDALLRALADYERDRFEERKVDADCVRRHRRVLRRLRSSPHSQGASGMDAGHEMKVRRGP